MGKIIYHIRDKKNLCGLSSDNFIIKNNKSLKDILQIINNNSKFITLCKRCKKSMDKFYEKTNKKS